MNNTEETIVKEIKKAFGKVKITCWDIRKIISVKKDGCLLYLDVTHKEELDYDVLSQDVKAVDGVYEAMKTLGYKKNTRGDIVLPGVNGSKLYDVLLKECQKQHKKDWKESGSAYDFSLIKEA